MVSSLPELYVKIAQVVVILIILVYFLYRRINDNIRGFDWFIVLFTMAMIQSVIEIALFFPTEYGPLDPNNSIQEIHIIPYIIGLFTLFLYTELIRNDKPNIWHLVFASAMVGGYLAVYFVELAFNLEIGILPEYRIFRIIFNIFQAFVLVQAFYIFLQDARSVEYKRLKNISLVIAISFAFAFLFAFLKIFERWTILIDERLQIYGAIPLGILFGVTAIIFIANPFYVYLLPTKINKIIVLNETGIPLYSVRIGKEEPKLFEDTLFSGTVSALKTLLTDCSLILL